MCHVGGPKKSHRSAEYIFLLVFEVSEGSLRNQKFIIGLDSFSKQRFILFDYVWLILVFVLTILLKVAKLQYFSVAPFCQILRVTVEA